MQVNLAHIRERAQNGGYIDFAVFDARSPSGSDSDNAVLLNRLTLKARLVHLKVDQAALAFSSGGRLRFFGSKPLVDHLSRAGLPRWTHTIDA